MMQHFLVQCMRETYDDSFHFQSNHILSLVFAINNFFVFTFILFLYIALFVLIFRCASNELLGLEGMVKIKNPDEHLMNGNHIVSIGADSDTKIPNNDVTDTKRY